MILTKSSFKSQRWQCFGCLLLLQRRITWSLNKLMWLYHISSHWTQGGTQEQPVGFAKLGKVERGWQWKNTLHGLKNDPQQWYQNFDSFTKFRDWHAISLQQERSLHYKKICSNTRTLTLFILYVDDMLATKSPCKTYWVTNIGPTCKSPTLNDGNQSLMMWNPFIQTKNKYI